MAQRHTIDKLEPAIRKLILGLLKDPRGVDEFTDLANDILEQEGAEARLSRSSAHRFMQGFEAERQAMKETQEITSAFAQELGDIPDTDSVRVLVEMLRVLITRVIRAQLRGEGERADTKDIMQLARSLRDTVTTLQGSVDLELKIREQTAKELVEKLDKAAGQAAEAGEKGLSAERMQQLRRDFLGVRDRPQQ